MVIKNSGHQPSGLWDILRCKKLLRYFKKTFHITWRRPTKLILITAVVVLLFSLTSNDHNLTAKAELNSIVMDNVLGNVGNITNNSNLNIFKQTDEPSFSLDTKGKIISSSKVAAIGDLKLNQGEISSSLKYHGQPIDQKPEISSNPLQDDHFNIKVEQSNQFQPGAYQLEVKITSNGQLQTLTQDFTWGVLAINFDQSSYKVDETANIGIGVLDDSGKTLCDSKVSLKIIDPEQVAIELSTEDKTIAVSDTCINGNVTNTPDYRTSYIPKLEGKYQIELKAETINGQRNLTDSFEVINNPDFVISRPNTSMRINPTSLYTVNINVKAYKDIKADIREKVPASFVITNISNGGEISSKDDKIQTITWPAELKINENLELSYQYDPPDISPEFFLLGPLEIWQTEAKGTDSTLLSAGSSQTPGTDSTGSTGSPQAVPESPENVSNQLPSTAIFTEPHPWQIASDVFSCVAKASGNWNAGATWNTCGASGPVAGDSVTINAAYTVTLTANAAASDITVSAGTLAITTKDLIISGNSTVSGGAVTIGISATNGWTTTDLTISSGSVTGTGASKIAIAGSYSNSGTFTASTGRVTFSATTSGKTLSGTLNGTSAFYKVTFNGVGGEWTINDSMKVSAANGTDDFIIGNGTVTLGNGNGDNLEVDGKMTIANTAGQTGTFQTTPLPEGSSLTLQMNKDSATSCTNCIIVVGATTGAGQGNLKIRKNTTLMLIPNAAASDAGIQTESTGYLEIQGSQDYTGTSNGTTDETTITNSTQSWDLDENNGKVVRITSGLAFGKIYDITETTATTLTRADNSSATETSPTVTGEGPTRTLTLTTQDGIITADNDQIGRYIHNTDTNTYYQIVDSAQVGAGTDTITIIAEPSANFDQMNTNNDIEVTDGVKTGDTYEILDYANVTAEAGTACNAHMGDTYEAYIYSKAGSENILRYANVCNMGKNAANKFGVSFFSINGANANEGVIVDKSKISNGYYGLFISGSLNNDTTHSKGVTSSSINNSSEGIYNLGSFNTFSFNNIYSIFGDDGYYNTGWGIYDYYGSANNTLTSNIIYNITGTYYDSGWGINSSGSNDTINFNIIYNNGSEGGLGRGIEIDGSNNTASSNNLFANSYEGIFNGSSNNTFISNNIYANGGGVYGYAPSTFISNNIYDNHWSGLQYQGKNSTFISNNIYDNAGYGISNTGDNNTFTSNNIYNNATSGINVYANDSTITANNIYNNNIGIRINYATNTTLTSNTVNNNYIGLLEAGSGTTVIGDSYGIGGANTEVDIMHPLNSNILQLYNTRYSSFPLIKVGYTLAVGKSASQVVGVAYDNFFDGRLAVFYDDGTYSVSLTDFNVDDGYVSVPTLYHYTLPVGKLYSQIVGITQDSWNNGNLGIFYDDGTYSSSNDPWESNADVSVPNVHNYTLADGYTPSQVIGVEYDSKTSGKLAVFYNDGKYSVSDDDSWDGTADISMPTVHSYTLAAGKSASQVLEVSNDYYYDGDLAVWYSDGTYSVSSADWDADSDIAAATLYDSSSTLPSVAISHQDNGTAGLTKIFGQYAVADQNSETPQDESSQKFNYADNSWGKSATPHGYSGTGDEDANLDYNLSTASLGSGPYSYRATVNNIGTDGLCTSLVKPTFDVYRNGVDTGLDATCNTQFTDTTDGVNVKFKIDGGTGTGYIVGDSYTFTVWDASGDANAQKTVEFQGDGDSLTASSGKTVEFNGAPGNLTNLSSLGSSWLLNLTDTSSSTASYVNVSHSANTGSSFCASYSVHDTPNTNVNWQISPNAICAVPTAATSFNGTPYSTTQINWGWNDNANDEENYRVEDSSHTNLSGDLAAGTTSWSETGLSANTQYTRHVNAINTTGNTDSSSASSYTLANRPATLTATASSTSQIKLDWSSGGAQTKFNLYRNGIAGVGTLVSSTNNLSFTDSDLSANTAYTYYLYAVNGDNVETTSYAIASINTPDNAAAAETSTDTSSSSVDQKALRLNVITKYMTSDFSFTLGINSVSRDDPTKREDINLTTDKTYDIYDQSPIFRGTTSPNSNITIEITDSSGRKITATATSDDDGYWQYQPTGKLTSGEYTIIVIVENKDKNINYTSDQYKFRIADNIKYSTPLIGLTDNQTKTKNKSFWIYLIILIALLTAGATFIALKRRRKKK